MSLTPKPPEPLAPAAAPGALEREIASLSPERLMVEARGLQVWLVRWQEAPTLMLELGRLREQTFRAAGEGTGRALDLDAFDAWYEQLVLWDAPTRRVLGGYRVGDVSRILAERGLDGLYTATLFHYGAEFFARHPGALEMGRSFLCADAQRSALGLSLLWQGIGRRVCKAGGLRYLFGPVSVDQGYGAESLDLLIGHLRAARWVDGAEAWVYPRTPYRPSAELNLARGASLPSERALDEALRRAQVDQRGLPVLLKQYLRLNAHIAAFNIDPDFSDVLDALIVVDLQSVERRRLARFMGAAEADRFLDRAVA